MSEREKYGTTRQGNKWFALNTETGAYVTKPTSKRVAEEVAQHLNERQGALLPRRVMLESMTLKVPGPQRLFAAAVCHASQWLDRVEDAKDSDLFDIALPNVVALAETPEKAFDVARDQILKMIWNERDAQNPLLANQPTEREMGMEWRSAPWEETSEFYPFGHQVHTLVDTEPREDELDGLQWMVVVREYEVE